MRSFVASPLFYSASPVNNCGRLRYANRAARNDKAPLPGKLLVLFNDVPGIPPSTVNLGCKAGDFVSLESDALWHGDTRQKHNPMSPLRLMPQRTIPAFLDKPQGYFDCKQRNLGMLTLFKAGESRQTGELYRNIERIM